MTSPMKRLGSVRVHIGCSLQTWVDQWIAGHVLYAEDLT